MSGPRDLTRWARLWLELPEDERRARASRVADRLLRRRPWIRVLHIAPETPSWESFAAALSRPLDETVDRLRHESPGGAALWPEAAEDLATTSAPAAPTEDWHVDRVTGVRWDETQYFTDVETVRGDGSDVKEPWDRARLQHVMSWGRDLSPLAAAEVDSFIAANPPGLGVNWSSPMEVALRAVSLSMAIERFRGCPGWDDRLLLEIARALWVHGRHVRANLEIPAGAPTTNHYLADLLGLLTIARTLPELRCASEWADLARAGLVEEMNRQVGADGVSFERSMPYHVFVTEMLLGAARLERTAGRPMPPAYLSRLATMLEAIAWSLRTDGSIPAWGDGDDGRILVPPQDTALADRSRLLALGGRETGRVDFEAPGAYAPWSQAAGRRFENSGWHVMRRAGAHLGVSAGPVGTLGLGNHTHNDLFAPVYWAGGREWIADPGTGSYARSFDQRNRLRGVAAHAALQLGNREPNELPPGRDGLFRVIERAHPEVLAWSARPDGARLVARHDGYSGPEGRWTWERTLELDARGVLSGLDRLVADDSTDVNAAPSFVWLRFPLAPGLATRIEPGASTTGTKPTTLALTDEAGREARLTLELPEGSEIRIETAEHSPRYGAVEPAQSVVVRMRTGRVVEARWSLSPEASG